MARAEGWWLGLVVLGLVLAESAVLLDLVAPGEVGLVAAGAAAAENGTTPVLVIAAATVGAVAGDSLGYVLGRSFGARLARRWAWSRRQLERASRHYERHGGLSVAVARWVGALRAVVPVVAGSARLGYGRFLAWDVPSAAAWSTVIVTVGYAWGDDVADVVDRAGLWMSVVAVALVAVLLVRSRWRHADETDETEGADEDVDETDDDVDVDETAARGAETVDQPAAHVREDLSER